MVIVLMLIPSTSWTDNRGIRVIPLKDKTGKEFVLYRESHALVIGVSEYEHWPTLPGVKKDVKLVRQALEEQGFNVVVVSNPDRQELESAFQDFINRYGQGVDNRLLFYFAGHGHTLKHSYGDEMGYIVPREAPNPHRNKTGFLSTAMDMQQIEVYAKRIQSKHALFLFDSCFSGSIFALSRAVPENISYKTSRPVRQFITAGGPDEEVPDESIFRAQFIAALQGEGDMDGDGYVSGAELGEFLQKKVTNYSKGTQHPQYGKIRNPHLDKGDFVFPLPKTLAKGMSSELSSLERERQKLEEEKRDLQKEKERMQTARLEPKQPPKEKKLPAAPKNMVLIPTGEFYAGADSNVGQEACKEFYRDCKREWYLDEGPGHNVVLDAFYMDKYEVTQENYERVMGKNPSRFKGLNKPVDSVSWFDAEEYCLMEGKRLPNEAEWEKAAGGGRGATYPWGNDFDSGKANICDKNCSKMWRLKKINDGYKNTAPVGSFPPNAYGLHDMAGNVWEWVADWYDPSHYRKVSQKNPRGPSSGEKKSLRGGAWDGNPDGTRVTNRGGLEPDKKLDHNGFRCAADVPRP